MWNIVIRTCRTKKAREKKREWIERKSEKGLDTMNRAFSKDTPRNNGP